MPQGRNRALDGLRAVAILPVVAYHSAYPLFGGGFLGVDVFFVLSGYLITGLLLHEYESTGRISFINFYARRALRLYPALIATVVLGLVLLALGLVVDERPLLHPLLALTYLQDVASGWFSDRGSIWGHTWSLAIEEHFYLLWPPALLVLASRGTQVVGWASAGVAVALFVASQRFDSWPTGGSPDQFFAPEVRGIPLLIGCALACMPLRQPPGRLSAGSAWSPSLQRCWSPSTDGPGVSCLQF